jgi:hypothetical protein
MTPLQPELDSLWLPLPGRAGVRRVRLRWLYDTPEPLDQPNLQRPRLEGASEGAALWTAWVPAGWEAARMRSAGASRAELPELLGKGPARMAALDLYRAEAQLEMVRALAEHGRGTDLAEAERRFLVFCDHAERALAVGANQGSVTGPSGQALGDWRAALRASNRALAQQHHFEEVLREVEREAASGSMPAAPTQDADAALLAGLDQGRRSSSAVVLPERGTPITWHGSLGTSAPQLQLVPAEAGRAKAIRAATARWLGLLAVAWLAALIPFIAGTLRRFWPEELALLGLWGWYQVGPTLLVLVLLVLGVGPT